MYWCYTCSIILWCINVLMYTDVWCIKMYWCIYVCMQDRGNASQLQREAAVPVSPPKQWVLNLLFYIVHIYIYIYFCFNEVDVKHFRRYSIYKCIVYIWINMFCNFLSSCQKLFWILIKLVKELGCNAFILLSTSLHL